MLLACSCCFFILFALLIIFVFLAYSAHLSLMCAYLWLFVLFVLICECLAFISFRVGIRTGDVSALSGLEALG